MPDFERSGLRPHKVRPWLHSPDPGCKAKVKRICDVYRNPPKDVVVLCIDEKPMQALERSYATTRDADGSVRPEYEYGRRGVSHLLAALNVQTGSVNGQVVPKRDGKALVRFMNGVARAYRGQKVYVIWNNLNAHYDGKVDRWTTFNRRHGGRFEFI